MEFKLIDILLYKLLLLQQLSCRFSYMLYNSIWIFIDSLTVLYNSAQSIPLHKATSMNSTWTIICYQQEGLSMIATENSYFQKGCRLTGWFDFIQRFKKFETVLALYSTILIYKSWKYYQYQLELQRWGSAGPHQHPRGLKQWQIQFKYKKPLKTVRTDCRQFDLENQQTKVKVTIEINRTCYWLPSGKVSSL